jgi:hypothetical protein
MILQSKSSVNILKKFKNLKEKDFMSKPATPIAGKVVERMYVSKLGETKFIYKPVYNSKVGDLDNLQEGQKYLYEYTLRNEVKSEMGMFWFATERTLVFFRDDEPTLTIGVPIANINYLTIVKEQEN